MVSLLEPELKTQCGHKESQKHSPAVTHEDFGRLKVPTQKSRCSAKHCSSKRGDKGLAVQVCKQGEEDGRSSGHSGTEAVHVVQYAEGGGDANDKKNSQNCVQNVARSSAQKNFENLCVNAGNQQNARGKRHSKEKFNLMVQQAPVIQNTYGGDDRRARQNSHDLGARC